MAFDGKLLIVANEGIREELSNGRTILNLIKKISPSNIAQFYLHGEPDKKYCGSFFRVTDNDALNTFLHRKNIVLHTEKNSESATNTAKKNIKKNCRTMFIRNLIWKSFCWWNKSFDDFINNFSPTVILLVAGDSPFMYAIARKIAKRMSIPVVLYTSENYVLKKKDI